MTTFPRTLHHTSHPLYQRTPCAIHFRNMIEPLLIRCHTGIHDTEFCFTMPNIPANEEILPHHCHLHVPVRLGGRSHSDSQHLVNACRFFRRLLCIHHRRTVPRQHCESISFTFDVYRDIHDS